MSSLIGMPSENGRYILCFLLCGCCCTMSVVLTYCLYIFNRIKALIIYKKRYPWVVKVECYTCLVMCGIIWPLWILSASEFATLANNTFADTINIIFFANHFVYPFFGHSVTCLEAGRLWVMYYKINHMNAISNNQWQSVIDNTSMMHNWYIMHSTTYGNLRWVMKRVFLYYAFASITSMLLITNFGFTAYTQAVDCFFYSVPVLSILYLYTTLLRHKSLIHDNFLFYLEFMTTNRIFSVGLLLYAFTPLMFALDPYYADMWTAMLGVTILTGPTVISALYIPRMILRNILWSNDDGYDSKLGKQWTDVHVISPGSLQLSPACASDTKSPSNTTISYVSSVYTEPPKKVYLDEIFVNRVYTQYFIHHIIKEFSLECALSYIEMKQFGYYLYTQLNALDDVRLETCMDPTINPDIEPLAQHIPQSTIVYDEEINDNREKVMQSFKDKFVALCDKYIDDKAEYQVNISYELKEELDGFKAMHEADAWNVSEKELLGVFHEVMVEMRHFMNTSLQRFTKSAEWEQIYKK